MHAESRPTCQQNFQDDSDSEAQQVASHNPPSGLTYEPFCGLANDFVLLMLKSFCSSSIKMAILIPIQASIDMVLEECEYGE